MKTPSILVPIGFSEQSMFALDEAVIFAKAMKAKITLLSVVEDSRAFRKSLAIKEGQDVKETVSNKLKTLAGEYADKSGVDIDTMIASGVVYEEIARVSELIEAQMVVMGTNGKPQNLRKRFIGSNAFRVVTLVQPPVITVKGVKRIDKIDTIIFPLIPDRRSKEKVGPALHYARLFGANIKVVSVLNDESQAKMLRANLKQVTNFINESGVKCSAELVQPKQKGVVRNVLNYAYDNEGDLVIILEDDKERDLTDFFLGTDVQAMIYHSEIPVMSITPSKVKYEAMWESF